MFAPLGIVTGVVAVWKSDQRRGAVAVSGSASAVVIGCWWSAKLVGKVGLAV